MALTKVVKEYYEARGPYLQNMNCNLGRQTGAQLSPAVTLAGALEQYSTNHGSHDFLLDIPCIPGGKINIVGTTCTESLRMQSVNVCFSYLETANPEDVQEIRSTILYHGLERLTSKPEPSSCNL